MTDLATVLSALPVTATATSDPAPTATDAELVAAVVDVLASPRVTLAPSSFVLHAPLELLARSALLPRVRPEARAGVRHRIAQIAAQYVSEG
jgi:hypothetical protein